MVDDEEPLRMLLQRILEEAGYAVLTSANGREALEKLSVARISLVLLDIRMPGLDGFQTLELIREKYELPVIMLTGMRELTSLSDALALGADDYIAKPFKTAELLARIKAKLRRNNK